MKIGGGGEGRTGNGQPLYRKRDELQGDGCFIRTHRGTGRRDGLGGEGERESVAGLTKRERLVGGIVDRFVA